MNESNDSAVTLCLEQVSSLDRDRYLMAMVAPQPARNRLLALFAFNIEVAQICESVSESILGRIRFQWWRDQISAAFESGSRPAGIAGALHDAIRQGDLSQHLFERLLDSRQRDLDQAPPQTLDELIDYCEGTSATLIELSMEILMGQKRDHVQLSQTARHAGIAWALCGLIRSIPYHAAHGRCHIPHQMVQAAGIQWEHIHHDPGVINPLVEALVLTAENHLVWARRAAKHIPPAAIASVLVIPMTRHYLAVLRKAAFNPYDARVQQTRNVSKTLRLMWAIWRKQV